MTGLVLAGGGVKGSYQIGAYLAIKKCKIKIDGIVGTSIGAFNGAMIVSGKELELYDFWRNVDVGYLLNFDPKYTDSVNNNEKFKEFIYGFNEAKNVIKNKGINNDLLKSTLNKIIDEKSVRESKIEYGLVTVRLDDLKPLYLFKKDIPKGKLAEYILASCSLPVFKTQKFSDDKLYVDGGFFDNNPVNMLIDKGYDKIYSIDLQGIGFKQKVKDKSKVVYIKPSKFLGSTLNVNKERINENIKLGYYDTLRVLKNYDGCNFIFKKYPSWVYNILVAGINKDLIKKCSNYFKVKTNKELVLKALEYIMTKEEYSYFDIYKPFREIRYIRQYSKSKSFIYKFVCSLNVI